MTQKLSPASRSLSAAVTVTGIVATMRVQAKGAMAFDVTPNRSMSMAMSFDVPIESCQAMIDSAPAALLPTVRYARFAGTFAANGRISWPAEVARPTYDALWQVGAALYAVNRSLPFVVAINCFDGAHRYDPAEVRAALELGPRVPVVLCDARQAESAKNVLITLVELVLDSTPDEDCAIRAAPGVPPLV